MNKESSLCINLRYHTTNSKLIDTTLTIDESTFSFAIDLKKRQQESFKLTFSTEKHENPAFLKRNDFISN